MIACSKCSSQLDQDGRCSHCERVEKKKLEEAKALLESRGYEVRLPPHLWGARV